MRYLSVCSGIEAATVAWHGLGWQPVGFSEIEKFPSQVLAHHYPSVPNVGDMTNYKEWDIGAIDLLVGGTPCQSFSVAGLRKGLEDPRGNLALVYCGILDHFRPQWCVWENVPGVLSSNGGRDFGSFLGALAELGYGFAYRVLDAQYFGVAQRRRRVFVIGHLGDWRPAAEVLFESKSLRRDTAPSREKGQRVAPTVVSGPPFSRTGNQRVECDAIVAVSDPAYCLETTCNDYSRAEGFNMLAQPISIHPHCIGRSPEAGPQGKEYLLDGSAYCMDSRGQPQAVAQPIPIDTMNMTPGHSSGGLGFGQPGDPSFTLTKGHSHAVAQPIAFGVSEKPDVGHCLRSGASKADKHESTTYVTLVNQPIAIQDTRPIEKAQNGRGWNDDGTAYTVDTHATQGVAQPIGLDEEQNAMIDAFGTLKARTLGGGFEGSVVQTNMAVRRLTPVECERLQGFPDNYTAVPWRGKADTPDGPRYKALGNSMAVPVMKWIGRRIKDIQQTPSPNKRVAKKKNR